MSTSSKTLMAHHCLSPKTTLYALRTAVEPVWAVVTRTFRLHLDESSHHRALFLTLSAVCLLIQCLDDLHKAAKFNSIYWSDSAHSWTERAKQYMTDKKQRMAQCPALCVCVCILYVWVFLWLWLFSYWHCDSTGTSIDSTTWNISHNSTSLQLKELHVLRDASTFSHTHI